jgi:DNA invertase Pin-like site-specific DNA recombinase
MLIGYLRVSTDTQDENNQRHAISELYTPDRWVAVECSSRKTQKARGITELLEQVTPGDVIIVTELSRLARGMGELVMMVEGLIAQRVGLIAIKQNINIPPDGKEMDPATMTLVGMFSLMANLERSFISMRTKMALAKKRSEGVILGKPVGTRHPCMLDDRIDEIRFMQSAGMSEAATARTLGCSRATLRWYVTTRHLAAGGTL